ncbi:hypothetical protein C8R45DRAFT_1084350 [Mycena sanguinolenta]|nr:hypothetical protein C8R45DRAFT_1084350 [Mycena sanguinolenta]
MGLPSNATTVVLHAGTTHTVGRTVLPPTASAVLPLLRATVAHLIPFRRRRGETERVRVTIGGSCVIRFGDGSRVMERIFRSFLVDFAHQYSLCR